MSKPVFTFSLIGNDITLQPCFFSGNEKYFYCTGDDFNKWFFSKIGYLLLNEQKTILIDHLLFTLLGGSNKWLSVINGKIIIKRFKTKNPIYAEFIKAVSGKILYPQGIETEYSVKFDTKITSGDFDEVLSFYYNKYVQSPPEIYTLENVPTFEQAIVSSKHHHGLYTTVNTDNNIYDSGNTLLLDQCPNAKNSLLLVYFFAELLENKEFCEAIRSCFSRKKVSAEEQMKIEKFLEQIDTK